GTRGASRGQPSRGSPCRHLPYLEVRRDTAEWGRQRRTFASSVALTACELNDCGDSKRLQGQLRFFGCPATPLAGARVTARQWSQKATTSLSTDRVRCERRGT